MAIIELAKEGGALSPTGIIADKGAFTGTQSTMLDFLKEIRGILDSPLVKHIVENKLGGGASSSTGFSNNNSGVPSYSNPQRNELPNPPPINSPQPTQVDYNDVLMKMIATPEGRNKIKDGLTELMKYTGDVKISELSKALEEFGVKNAN